MPRPAKNQHVLAVLRRAIGLGQQQLAARLGVSQSFIQKIELSERTLTREIARRMADYTSVDIDWLLAGDYRQPPPAATGGRLTRERFERHRAWVESARPASDAQWAQFQKWVAGATIGLAGGQVSIPDDPAKQRRRLADSVTQELRLEITREGRRVALPKSLQAVEGGLIKRLQGDLGRSMRRGKVAELRREFEGLTQAVWEHQDGDFLLWQLKELLAEFRQTHGLLKPL